MRAAALLAVLLTVPVLAGCVDGGGPDAGRASPTAGASTVAVAPWWKVGEYWDVDIERAAGGDQSIRLVNFLNDSETSHFWLGVADRRVAMDMALHDNNPLLGRIHWGILTPHESGIHATGMFTFPTEPGDTFGGLMFGRQWEVRTSAGDAPGKLEFRGTSTDRYAIAYDYDPANRWFTFVEIKDAKGAVDVRFDVTAHGYDAKGTYWFLRGRDYYEGPAGAGVREEAFTVKDEGAPMKSLAVELAGATSGPLRIDFVDASGAVRHSETLTGGRVAKVVEIPSPAVGEWKIRYVGAGGFEGVVRVVGIIEYTATL